MKDVNYLYTHIIEITIKYYLNTFSGHFEKTHNLKNLWRSLETTTENINFTSDKVMSFLKKSSELLSEFDEKNLICRYFEDKDPIEKKSKKHQLPSNHNIENLLIRPEILNENVENSLEIIIKTTELLRDIDSLNLKYEDVLSKEQKDNNDFKTIVIYIQHNILKSENNVNPMHIDITTLDKISSIFERASKSKYYVDLNNEIKNLMSNLSEIELYDLYLLIKLGIDEITLIDYFFFRDDFISGYKAYNGRFFYEKSYISDSLKKVISLFV